MDPSVAEALAAVSVTPDDVVACVPAGGTAQFTDSARLRLDLYRCYLYLIMLVETVPRRYSREQRAVTWKHAGRELVAALDAVGSAVAGRA